MKGPILYASVLLLSLSLCIGCNEDDGRNTIILENGYYFNGKIFVPFGELIIKNDKIVAISSNKSKRNGQRIPLNGKYVIPGLIDAHVHLGSSPLGLAAPSTTEYNANSCLNCGVTTVIDLFYPENKCRVLKQVLRRVPAYYTSPVMAGPILTAPGGHGTEYQIPTRTITSVNEAEHITNDVIDSGADVIKLVYNYYYDPQHALNYDMLKHIVGVAHKRHKKVFAHINLTAEAIECADAGVDVLAHIPSDSFTNEQLHKLKASGIILTPTITIMQVYSEGFDSTYLSDPLLHKTGNPAYLSGFGNTALPALAPYIRYCSRINLRNCIKYKIPILAGTDAGNPYVFYGYSLHNEIQQYVKEGMTNAEALCSATENIQLVFSDCKTGKIKEGYDADLVILNADPLDNISNTKSIEMVFHKGQLAKMLK